MSTSTTELRRIVLCGSMRAFDTMVDVHDALAARGIDAVLPEPDEVSVRATSAQYNDVKRRASLKHFSHIQDESTQAILVVNVDKDGQHDYIGPNSFAEIAVAFAAGRSVYLWQSIPRTYEDELRAWGALELHGELAGIAATSPDQSRSHLLATA